MHAIRQKCRPKHQVLILKCYPRTTKGAVDVKPNSSELSYLLYYATTRRSKVQKVGAFLEKKTASDVWRARIGNVQVTLQILAALIEKAPRDLPLYAPYVLKILSIILRSRDITMAEASVPTFQAFCEHHDGASLSADQEYLYQYEEIVKIYASFASTQPPPSKTPISAPVALRWRGVGLEAIKSIAISEVLISQASKQQLDIIVPMLLENLWTDDMDVLNTLQHRVKVEEKVDTERLLRRRTSIATVRTAESTEANAAALSGTTADADKLAEEDIGVVAIQCLKAIFVVNNRAQIYVATTATLEFIAARVTQKEIIIQGGSDETESRGWAIRVFDMIARWAPVQDRYIILVTAMDVLVRSPLVEDNLQQQLVLATMIDSLLKSDINLIGLSVMDVLLGLVQHVLRTLQLRGAVPHLQPDNGTDDLRDSEKISTTDLPYIGRADSPTDVRRDLLARLQSCIGDLATHIYYADQISDMVTAILLRLKPSPLSAVPNGAVAVENPGAASAAVTAVGDLTEDPNTDGFFSFDTAKVKALEAIKSILIVASKRKTMTGGGNLGRNQVPVRVWEGTQWLLRDPDGRVRKTYVDALHVWLDYEVTRSDLRVSSESPKAPTRTTRDDSANLTRRAVSNASHREKAAKPSRTNFLRLLHLAIYENALQFVESETDIVLLHFLLTKLVTNLGVNAVKDGLPMIFRLQEDILDAETPIAKIRMGSLCHGYFWTLTEIFEFESSPVGRSIHNEIRRRQSKSFWVDRVRLPPIPVEDIATPVGGTPQETLPLHKVETESLNPFDDRFQMVKLISLSYSASFTSPPSSPPTSPGRSFNQPILTTSSVKKDDQNVPEKIKDEMMSEWNRESVIATVQESSKTVSLNGSKAGTNATGHRNFLAVNGSKTGGTNSGSQSPQRHSHTHNSHGSKPPSTYGLIGGLGSLKKIRKDGAPSPSPASESSRNSVTRVDQLKRIISGQHKPLEGARSGLAYSDASSDSMVSFDYTASEVSFNHNQQTVSVMDHAASQPAPRERSRSKSRDRMSAEHQALSSHPVLTPTDPNVPRKDTNPDAIPPVPTIPAALTAEGTLTQDHISPDKTRKSRSVRRSTKSRGGQSAQDGSESWGTQSASIADLESLLKGIDVGGGDQKGNIAKPPY